MANDNPIKDQQKTQAFVTWSDDSGKRQALADTSDNIDSYDGIQKAVAYNRRSFLDLEPNRSVRTGFTREDYNSCLLYTSPSPRDRTRSRMPSSA